jgi:hypothetical protein
MQARYQMLLQRQQHQQQQAALQAQQVRLVALLSLACVQTRAHAHRHACTAHPSLALQTLRLHTRSLWCDMHIAAQALVEERLQSLEIRAASPRAPTTAVSGGTVSPRLSPRVSPRLSPRAMASADSVVPPMRLPPAPHGAGYGRVPQSPGLRPY